MLTELGTIKERVIRLDFAVGRASAEAEEAERAEAIRLERVRARNSRLDILSDVHTQEMVALMVYGRKVVLDKVLEEPFLRLLKEAERRLYTPGQSMEKAFYDMCAVGMQVPMIARMAQEEEYRARQERGEVLGTGSDP